MKRGRRRLVAVLLCCLLVLSSATIALAEEAPAAPSEDTAAQIGDKTENITDEQEPGKEEDSAPIVEDGVAEEEEKIEETEKIEEKNETKDLPEKQEGPLLDSAQNTVDIVSKEAVDALILEPEARETEESDTKIPTLDHIEKSADPSKTAIFYVAAKGVTDDRSGVKSVEFAVWSEKNGQDDLKWYKGTKDGADSWSVGVSVLNHKMDTGKYQIHVYATDNAGNRGLVGTTTLVSDFVDNQAPTVAASNILNGDIYGGSKVIYLGGVSDQSGVKSVQAAIWGADYGQDDLKWYSLTNRGNGNWDMTLSLAEHGGPFFDEGIYNVHIYTEDVLGNRACVYTTDFYVEPAVASAGDAEVYYYDFFDSIWVYDISCSTGVSGVFYNFYNEYDDIYVEAHYTDFLTSGDLYLDDMIQPYGTCNLDVGVLDMRGRFYIVGQYYFTV